MILSWQFVRFCVVGLLTAALYYGLLYAAVEFRGVDPTLASSAVYFIVIGVNYLLHRSWTFSTSGSHRRTLSRYLVMVLCGFAINGLVMYVGVSQLAINYLLTQTLAIVLVVLWNFTLASLWVFRP